MSQGGSGLNSVFAFLACGLLATQAFFFQQASEPKADDPKTIRPQALRSVLRWRDLEGRDRPLFPRRDARAICILFVSTDCPISNSYQPELRRLHQQYEPEGIAFVMLHATAGMEPERIREHIKNYEIEIPVGIDSHQDIAKALQATTIPEAFVLSADGETVWYRGRIDNLYEAFGKKRPKPSSRELRDALHAIVTGQEVPIASTDPIGCRLRIEPGP
jgi:hypothetical protein